MCCTDLDIAFRFTTAGFRANQTSCLRNAGRLSLFTGAIGISILTLIAAILRSLHRTSITGCRSLIAPMPATNSTRKRLIRWAGIFSFFGSAKLLPISRSSSALSRSWAQGAGSSKRPVGSRLFPRWLCTMRFKLRVRSTIDFSIECVIVRSSIGLLKARGSKIEGKQGRNSAQI